MRKTLLWLGVLLSGTGATLIAASIVLSYMGLGASYNFGDPTKFQFILVPFWHIGVAVLAVGGGCLAAWRWVRQNA